MAERKKRAEQKIEDTWALEDIYASDDLWDEDAKKLELLLDQFSKYQGQTGESGQKLQEILEAYSQLNELFGKLYVYANMRFHEDMGNGTYQQLSGKSEGLRIKTASACAWLQPEILQLDWGQAEAFLKETPSLEKYRVYLKDLFRQKAHTLSKEQEELLAQARELGQAPERIFGMLQNADLTFEAVAGADGKQIPLTKENFVVLEENPDRKIRKEAFEHLYQSYANVGNTMAALFDANVRQELFFARQRKYQNALEASLDEAPIPFAVYDQLIDTVHCNLPLMHRYVQLRRKLLKIDELHMYDVYVPMVPEAGRTYRFEEAKQLVLEGLKPLGEEYTAILKEGFEHRWIDVYENEGKRGGAYSWGSYGTHPYVLMNYQGSLQQVFTLAHEMGHSIHSYYTRKSQPFIYGSYYTFVAEVASTCNEVLMIRYLLQKAEDPKERNYLRNHFLEQFKSTLFRQTMFAEFEKKMHAKAEAGETLTAEILCGEYLRLNQEYFGAAMVSDPQIAWEWARIPHFYTPFYVYQYATGLSAAVAIAEKIWKQEPGAVENYKRFLSSGCSMMPIELLKLCGVDMTSPQPVQDALDLFAKYLEEMENC